MSKSNVLFLMSGSISCYKACNTISMLVQNNCEVKVACTKATFDFVGQSTFEGLTGKPAAYDLFAEGHGLDHINLSKWADVAILCPATANVINKFANGIADDLVTSSFLAYDLKKKPYIIAPAMNHLMYSHPVTQESIVKLSKMGVNVLPTAKGRQACGDIGYGRLLEPKDIFETIMQTIKAKQ